MAYSLSRVPLPMYEVSCEDILLYEQILTEGLLRCLSCRIRDTKAPDIMGTQTKIQKMMEREVGKQV